MEPGEIKRTKKEYLEALILAPNIKEALYKEAKKFLKTGTEQAILVGTSLDLLEEMRVALQQNFKSVVLDRWKRLS